MTYVCWRCRYRPPSSRPLHHVNTNCPKCGGEMKYVHVSLPASRDDHKMWQLAEEKSRTRNRPFRRPRRRPVRWSKLKDWERELLKAASK